MTFLRGVAVAVLIVAAAFILGGCSLGHGLGHNGHYGSSQVTGANSHGTTTHQPHAGCNHRGY